MDSGYQKVRVRVDGSEWFDVPKYITIEMGTFVDQITLVMLFCVTLVLNLVALQVVRKYREKYD